MKFTLFQNPVTRTTMILSLVSTVAFASTIAYLRVRSRAKTDDTLIVGMMSGWAPFMTITAKGTYEGFDVDVAQELAQRMGKKLVIQDLGSLHDSFTLETPCFSRGRKK